MLCVTWPTVYWAVDACLQLNCVAITADRYCAVCHPLKRIFTVKRMILIIVIIEVIGFSFEYCEDFLQDGMDYVTGQFVALYVDPRLNEFFGIFTMVFFDFAPVFALVVFYPQMIYVLVNASRSLSAATQNAGVHDIASRRLVRTILIAAIALIISNTPDVVFFSIMTSIMGLDTGFGSWQQAIQLLFKSVYPVISPIVYSLSTAKFRNAVCKAFCR